MGMHYYKVLFYLSPFKSEILAFNPRYGIYLMVMCIPCLFPQFCETYLVGLEMRQVEKTAYRAMDWRLFPCPSPASECAPNSVLNLVVATPPCLFPVLV